MELLTEERIGVRLATAEALLPFKRKIHKLRRLTLGDASVLTNDQGGSQDVTLQSKYKEQTGEFFDIMVTDFVEGRSNKMLQAIRTLIFQTAYEFPEMEFEDLEPGLASLNSLYLKYRLGPAPIGCDAKVHMRKAFADYCTGGIGWSYVYLSNDGLPCVEFADTIDMAWDLKASSLGDITWAACVRRASLGEWIDIFGVEAFKEEAIASDLNLEKPADLLWYYDTHGKDGNMMVTRKVNPSKPVYKGKNPLKMPTPAGDIPMLPFTPVGYLEIPSSKLPMSIAEMMLSNQIAMWEDDRYIREVRQRGAPSTLVEEGALDPKELESWLEGEIGAVVKVKPGGLDKIRHEQGMEIPQTILKDRQINDMELTAQSGANPYASGNPVQGVDFASEVQAIQGNAGLTAGVIGKDNAGFWKETGRKVLAIGYKFDNKPFRVNYDGVQLDFDRSNPIKQYLAPMSDITVREDTMQFKSSQERIAAAAADLDIAMKLVGYGYQANLDAAVEGYLSATGEKNVSRRLEKVAPPMQAGSPAINPADLVAKSA